MIPYFYLKVGDIEIFQPQNKGTRELSFGNVYVIHNPEITSHDLFLNGNKTSLHYQICINIRNGASQNLYEMVSKLKELEE